MVGCSANSPKTEPSTVAPTPLSRLNTAEMKLARVDFCHLVPTGAVRDAVGSQARRTTWGNGSVAQLGPVKDVSHEFGCSWTGGDGAASAWIFAMPVDAQLARQAQQDARVKGCTVTRSTFGDPSFTQSCTGSPAGARVRYAGLFGSTWLTCQDQSSTLPATTLDQRARAWCVEIANAVNTQR